MSLHFFNLIFRIFLLILTGIALIQSDGSLYTTSLLTLLVLVVLSSQIQLGLQSQSAAKTISFRFESILLTVSVLLLGSVWLNYFQILPSVFSQTLNTISPIIWSVLALIWGRLFWQNLRYAGWGLTQRSNRLAWSLSVAFSLGLFAYQVVQGRVVFI